MQKKVGFSRTGSVQADRLIINNGLTASTTYNFYGLTAISFNLPVVDGTNGQALKTDGAGNLSFGAVAVSSTSGTSGTSGANGATGANGANGTSGTSGANGIAGSSGTSGTRGTSGTSGANGAAGANGTSGTSGANGVAGSSGTSGTRGTSGTSGANGAAGANGTSGTSGANGAAGVNGTSGTSGQSGSSGTSGLTGTSGTSGANGVGNATILGTTNYLPKFIGATALGDSAVYETNSQLVVPDGTSATPSITFASNTALGFWKSAGFNEINTVVNGTNALFVSQNTTRFRDGSVSIPGISFISDTNTGIFRASADNMQLVTNGVARIVIGAGPINFASTSQVSFGQGSAATPSFIFTSDTDTGIYSPEANQVGIAVGGATAATFRANGLTLPAGSGTNTALRFGDMSAASGIVNPFGNEMSFYSGGAIPLYLSSSRLLASKTTAAAASPNISFQGDLDTGIYSPGDNLIAISTGGVTSSLFDSNGIEVVDGSVGTPSISFISDTDTGMYRIADNIIGFSTNGIARFELAVTYNRSYVNLRIQDGTAATPGLHFTSDQDTGLFKPATNKVAISAGGATAAVFGSTNSITNRTYFEKAVNHYPVVNASVSGTYTVDMSASNVFNLTLTGNTTLDYSNQSEGSYMLLINQDGTGGRSLSFTSGGKFIGATAVSIGTASNAKSVIQLTHIGTQSIVTYQTNLVNL
jgi:hypothetical protein